MNDTRPSERSAKRRFAIRAAAVVLFGSVIAGLTAPMVIRSRKDPLMREYFYLKRCGTLLWDFADANDGRFPRNLDELASYSGSGAGFLTPYHSPKTGVRADWLYFSGFDTRDRSDTILMASPVPITRADGTMYVQEGVSRLVLALDGRTAILKETDYQECIAQQNRDSWRNAEHEKPGDPWGFLSNPAWTNPIIPKTSTPPPDEEIREWLAALKNGTGIGRWNAADKLAEMGPVSPEIVPALLNSLGDSEAGYHCAKGLAVMSLTDDSILPRLVQAMKSQNPKEEYWAAVAIEEIGLTRVKDAIPMMTAALSRKGDDITVTAAKALAGAGPAAAIAVPQLLEVAKTGDEWARKCAIIALGRIGPEARLALPELLSMFRNGTVYQIDVARAIWKIDPSKGNELALFLIETIKGQQVDRGPNHPLDNRFFSALDLLAELGPAAVGAEAVLKSNLRGGARVSAAWALVRIDPALRESVVPIIASSLNPRRPGEDRIRRLNTWRKSLSLHEPQSSEVSPSAGLEACGMLWQLYPDRREAMTPVLIALLCEWRDVKGLSSLSPDLRKAIQALEDLLESQSLPGEIRKFAMEALQEIRTLDPGDW
jgi:hypothetical protein